MLVLAPALGEAAVLALFASLSTWLLRLPSCRMVLLGTPECTKGRAQEALHQNGGKGTKAKSIMDTKKDWGESAEESSLVSREARNSL